MRYIRRKVSVSKRCSEDRLCLLIKNSKTKIKKWQDPGISQNELFFLLAGGTELVQQGKQYSVKAHVAPQYLSVHSQVSYSTGDSML